MSVDEMTDRITELLQEGIRETIENRDAGAFERAAKAAYTVRTAGLALSDDDAIINHVFPSDVRQSVALGLHLVDSDKEKASVVLKGALEAILQRLSVVAAGQLQEKPNFQGAPRRWWWPFGNR